MLKPSNTHLSVVIPAYNEELRLPETLRQVVSYLIAQSYQAEILVVDDGSIDGTEQVARSWYDGPVSLRVIGYSDRANRGKGAAIKLGMMEAQGAYRLFMDADNSTTLDQVAGFWPYFEEGYDVVIGSRAVEGSIIGLPQAKYKEIAGRLGNWIVRFLVVPQIFDTQAGFKMLTQRSAEDIIPRLTIEGWGYDVELLAIAMCRGYRVREVPITWINSSGSKVTMKSYFQVLSEVWRIRRNLKAGLYK